MKFTASRLSDGNKMFPDEVIIDSDSITVRSPEIFGGDEKTLPIDATTVEIHSPMIGFSDITFYSYGNRTQVHGFTSSDAKRIRDLIEENKERSKSESNSATSSDSSSSNNDLYDRFSSLYDSSSDYTPKVDLSDYVSLEKYNAVVNKHNKIFDELVEMKKKHEALVEKYNKLHKINESNCKEYHNLEEIFHKSKTELQNTIENIQLRLKAYVNLSIDQCEYFIKLNRKLEEAEMPIQGLNETNSLLEKGLSVDDAFKELEKDL